MRMRDAMTKLPALLASSAIALSLVPGCSQPQGQQANDAGDSSQQQTDDSSRKVVSANPQGATEETVVTETPIDSEKPADSEKPKSDLTADRIPVASRLPEGRTMDEVADALIAYVAKAYPTRNVSSVEIYGNDSEGQSVWISYLIKFSDADDVGVEITCSAITAPFVQELDIIRVFGNRTYNVRNKEYKDAEPSDDGAEEAPQVSGQEFSGGRYVGNKTEGSPPDRVPVLVSDDHGNMVWVVPGDLG